MRDQGREPARLAPRGERRVLTPDELWALADAMPERYRAAVVVSFLSGLRAGELFALQRRHVDLVAGAVRVEQSLARPGTGGGRFSSTKSRAGLRTVALPAVALEVLTEHLSVFTPAGRDALVFGTINGRPLTGGHRTTMFHRARRPIGLRATGAAQQGRGSPLARKYRAAPGVEVRTAANVYGELLPGGARRAGA